MTSKTDESSESVDAGSGIWKDLSKSKYVGTIGRVRVSETACRRLPSTLGRFGREKLESPSDKHLFFEGSNGETTCAGEAPTSFCSLGDSWDLESSQWGYFDRR